MLIGKGEKGDTSAVTQELSWSNWERSRKYRIADVPVEIRIGEPPE